MQDKIRVEFYTLPAEAQRQVADFIAFLHQRYQRATPKKRPLTDWEDEPFIGMWQDREDMQDSSAWIRHTRQREWGGHGG